MLVRATTSGDPEALRCGTDESEIVDPCWPSPDRNEVACPDVPWSRDVVLLNPVTVPPRGELEEGYTERPWGLELIVDGEGRIRCVALSSWAGEVQGARRNYGCSASDGVHGGFAYVEPDQSTTTWTISCGRGQ